MNCADSYFKAGCPFPWLWAIACIVGAALLMWGWTNSQEGRHLPQSPIAFLLGVGLFGVSLFTLLPWLVDNT